MVQESVPKHQVFPNVNFLTQDSILLKSHVLLDNLWIEQTLRDLHMLLILDHHVQTPHRLWDTRRATAIWLEPEVWDARNQTDEGLF